MVNLKTKQPWWKKKNKIPHWIVKLGTSSRKDSNLRESRMTKVSSSTKMRSSMKRINSPDRRVNRKLGKYSIKRMKIKIPFMMRIKWKLKVHRLKASSMGLKPKSPLETTKRPSSKKVKIETPSSTSPQVSAKPVLPLLLCTTTCHTHKRKRLFSLPTPSNLLSSRQKPSKRPFMESYRTNLCVKNSTKSMMETTFISTGPGKESAERLYVFMAKKMMKLGKPKRRKSKAALWVRRSSWGNFKTPLLLWWSLRCSSTVYEEDLSNLQTFLSSCSTNATIVKATIHMLGLWMSFTLIWRKSWRNRRSCRGIWVFQR